MNISILCHSLTQSLLRKVLITILIRWSSDAMPREVRE